MITILTTTYNRKHTLPRIYESLLRQTDFDFEWVIVDDGSTDDTDRDWMQEGKIPITYKYKNNGGMHTACNAGAEVAQRELILKLDSDDCLVEDAIAMVKRDWETVKNVPMIAGVAYLNAHLKSGGLIGNAFHVNRSIRSLIQMRFHDRVRGDKTEVIKTEIYRAFPYPEFEGERRTPTSIVHIRISKAGYRFLLVNEIIKYVEYLPDGLGRNKPFTPNAYRLLFNERTTKEFPMFRRWRAMRRYVKFSKQSKKTLALCYSESYTKWLCLLVLITEPWCWFLTRT